jgi:hypothetical protein
MSRPTGEDGFEVELEVEVEAELTLIESSRPEETAGRPVSEWLFDPSDAEREEIELRGLLGAVEELGGGSEPGGSRP